MLSGWKQSRLILAATLTMASGALAQGDAILAPPPGAPGPAGGGLIIGMGQGLPAFLVDGASLLRLPEVQRELKLTEQQKTRLAELLHRLGEQQRSRIHELDRLTPEEIGRRLQAWQADAEKQVEALLTADQQKRLRQLRLQQQGLPALLDPAVAAELKLSEEQRGRIRTILQERDQALRSLFQTGPGGPDAEKISEKVRTLWKQSDEKILAALTEAQRRQWKAMQGAPFTFRHEGPLMLPPAGDFAPEAAPLPADPSLTF